MGTRCGTVQKVSLTLCALFLIATVAYARADEKTPQAFDIGPQALNTALAAFARQSHEEILFAPDVVASKRTGGVRGTMLPLVALKILLKESDLPFSNTPSGAVLVGASPLRAQASNPAQSHSDGSSDTQEVGKNSSHEFRLAQVDQATAGSQVAPKQIETKGSAVLEEVIVTAEKKDERLLDVPVPVTAIAAETLVERNQLRLQDYYTSVPGLIVSPGDAGGGAPNLTIRGITTAGGNPTVGVTVDDVPYGSSTQLGGGAIAPDFDPSDLSRVEVLRGPQGTLYGASSIGGLLKFITVDPSTDALVGRVQGGLSGVSNGDQLGYNVRGAINIPLSDVVAIRASGFDRLDPGYIDDPFVHENGVNKSEASGGRLSALWRPSNEFSLKLGAFLQTIHGDGAPFIDIGPGLGDLQQSAPRSVGAFDRHFQVYSAVIHAKVGIGDLAAISGYSINSLDDSVDYSGVLGPLNYLFFPKAADGAANYDHNKTRKFSQEIRYSAAFEHVDWLVGAFYTHESTHFVQDILALDQSTGTNEGSWVNANFPQTFSEYAAFTDLTLHWGSRFDLQLGARESRNQQTYSEVDTGPYDLLEGQTSPIVNPKVDTRDNSFTYLVTPSFKLSPDLMLYARLASGYRPGGPNPTSTVFGYPPQFGPDKTLNYEIGSKGSFLDHKLSFDASAYYIDWKDLQLTVIAPGGVAGYFTNASRAKSEGVEFATQARPLDGLLVTAWVAWNEAVLTKGFPPTSVTYGAAGNPLPYTARFTGNIAVDQHFPLGKDLTGFVGASESYVGDRQGVFSSTAQRQYLPSFAQTDLRAGLTRESWELNFFATNITNRRGVLSGGLGTINPQEFYLIQPRAVGMFLTKTF
jgi:iron complex outermembrane recepter protein